MPARRQPYANTITEVDTSVPDLKHPRRKRRRVRIEVDPDQAIDDTSDQSSVVTYRVKSSGKADTNRSSKGAGTNKASIIGAAKFSRSGIRQLPEKTVTFGNVDGSVVASTLSIVPAPRRPLRRRNSIIRDKNSPSNPNNVTFRRSDIHRRVDRESKNTPADAQFRAEERAMSEDESDAFARQREMERLRYARNGKAGRVASPSLEQIYQAYPREQPSRWQPYRNGEAEVDDSDDMSSSTRSIRRSDRRGYVADGNRYPVRDERGAMGRLPIRERQGSARLPSRSRRVQEYDDNESDLSLQRRDSAVFDDRNADRDYYKGRDDRDNRLHDYRPEYEDVRRPIRRARSRNGSGWANDTTRSRVRSIDRSGSRRQSRSRGDGRRRDYSDSDHDYDYDYQYYSDEPRSRRRSRRPPSRRRDSSQEKVVKPAPPSRGGLDMGGIATILKMITDARGEDGFPDRNKTIRFGKKRLNINTGTILNKLADFSDIAKSVLDNKGDSGRR